jgi:hypothetical protein
MRLYDEDTVNEIHTRLVAEKNKEISERIKARTHSMYGKKGFPTKEIIDSFPDEWNDSIFGDYLTSPLKHPSKKITQVLKDVKSAISLLNVPFADKACVISFLPYQRNASSHWTETVIRGQNHSGLIIQAISVEARRISEFLGSDAANVVNAFPRVVDFKELWLTNNQAMTIIRKKLEYGLDEEAISPNNLATRAKTKRLNKLINTFIIDVNRATKRPFHPIVGIEPLVQKIVAIEKTRHAPDFSTERADTLKQLFEAYDMRIRGDSAFAAAYINGLCASDPEEVLMVSLITRWLFDKGGHVAWKQNAKRFEAMLRSNRFDKGMSWVEAYSTLMETAKVPTRFRR